MTTVEICWCGCIAAEYWEHRHAAEDHTSCGATFDYPAPCGNCDDCISSSIAHSRRLEREEV